LPNTNLCRYLLEVIFEFITRLSELMKTKFIDTHLKGANCIGST
jgi:hypothetical protein